MLAAIYGIFGSIVQRVSTANILASPILHVAKFCYFGVSSVMKSRKPFYRFTVMSAFALSCLFAFMLFCHTSLLRCIYDNKLI